MADKSGIILHHYDPSPFSAKVRQLLAIKGLDWQSVIMPDRMPKPDLIPLTGGYRRAPVMQIGADIYCDSQVMMAEIERLYPQPHCDIGMAWPINLWADRLWFQHTVAIIFGKLGDRVEQSFIEDREKLSGRPFDIKGMMAAAGPAKGLWRAQAAWIDRALADSGKPYLSGDAPGIADVAAYMNIWFLAGSFPKITDALLAGLDTLAPWRTRMASIAEGAPAGLGNLTPDSGGADGVRGAREEIAAAKSHEAARNSEPMPLAIEHDAHDPTGIAPGSPVVVAADDYGRDPISGTLMAADASRIIIARDTEDFGRLHLHFPRAGFALAAA